VLDLALDFLDARHFEASPLLDRGQGLRRDDAALGGGTTPRSASTSVAAISTASHLPKRLSSDHRRAMSGRE
jgi:hypothetical protein